MFYVRRPSKLKIDGFLLREKRLAHSYAEIGASRGKPPAGYTVDHYRTMLGHGLDVFRRAQEALMNWAGFDIGWLRAFPDSARVVEGATVALLVNHFGFWSLNACRVVYVLNEVGPIRRVGFAYGTLPDHAEQGEERFLIEHRVDNDEVAYEILAFSRPKHWMAKTGYPLSRGIQKRFARDSQLAMARATAD